MNLFAIILVMLSSVTAAYFIIRKEIKHCRRLDDAIDIVNTVKNRALYYSEPLTEIMHQLQKTDKTLYKAFCGAYFDNIDSDQSVPDAWETAVKSTFDKDFEIYEQDVLIHFGKDLCGSNRNEIEKLTDNAIYALKEFRKTATDNKNNKSKSTAAVAVSAGIMIVLMFA